MIRLCIYIASAFFEFSIHILTRLIPIERMKYNKISAKDRSTIYEAYKNGEDWRSVAKTLKISTSTAYKWLLADREEPKRKGGCYCKKTNQAVQKMQEVLEQNCLATLEDLQRILLEELNVNVCKSTISNWLDGQLISLKNTRNEINNMNKNENKAKRAEYMNLFFENRAEGRTIVWVDETNFNLYCKRKKGRSKIGTRASVVIPASKGANLHCIGAMTTSAVVYFSTKRGSFKAEDCLQWFRDLVAECHNQGIENPTFVVDNSPNHCRLENIPDEFPHVKLLRLAPYSYLLNPIELMWSVFKSHLKRKLAERMPFIMDMERNAELSIAERRMREMESIAGEVIQLITPNMLLAFANRVERYYPTAARQEDLKEFP